MAELISYKKISDRLAEVSDQEISWLASHTAPRDMHRIAVEYLHIPQIDVDHMEHESRNNSWKFNSACYTYWKKSYLGPNMREDLYNCLIAASNKGLIAKDQLQFLLSDLIRCPELPIPDLSFQRSHPSCTASAEETNCMKELAKLAAAFSNSSIEDAAVNVLGFSQSDFHFQKCASEQNLMFSLLSSWWRIQGGSPQDKKLRLFERLLVAEKRGLINRTTVQNFKASSDIEDSVFHSLHGLSISTEEDKEEMASCYTILHKPEPKSTSKQTQTTESRLFTPLDDKETQTYLNDTEIVPFPPRKKSTGNVLTRKCSKVWSSMRKRKVKEKKPELADAAYIETREGRKSERVYEACVDGYSSIRDVEYSEQVSEDDVCIYEDIASPPKNFILSHRAMSGRL